MEDSRGCQVEESPPSCSYPRDAGAHQQRSRLAAPTCLAPLLYAACMALLLAHAAGAASMRQLQEAHSKLHRRQRRDHAGSSGRTLSDASGGMPHSFYQRSVNMGVFQTTLAGVLDAGEGRREPAALYLYLKGMRHAEVTTFRGFMFLESADHEWYNWGGTGLCMPRIALDWLPRVFFRSVAEPGREWDFTVRKELMFREVAEPEMGTEEERARVCVPFPLEVDISNSEAGLDFEIHVEGWKNFAYYSPGAVHVPVPATPAPAGTKEVVALLVPFLHPTPQAIANNLLYFYVRYHLELGFSKFVQYTQATFLAGFWEDARLRRLWAEGALEFVLWDSSAECVGHLKCMQPLMYSHAILAFWGQPVYLSLADHDEYLALPSPERAASVQDLIATPGCFDGLTQVNMRRYNTVCGPGQCEWQEGAVGRAQNWELQKKPDPQLVEVDLWAGASDWKHPMEHYTLRAREAFTEDRGKCMVDPNHMAGFNVHYGMVLPSGSKQPPPEGYLPWGAPIDESCAVWLHLVNLFTGRDNRTTHEVDMRWHWIFDRISGYRIAAGDGST